MTKVTAEDIKRFIAQNPNELRKLAAKRKLLYFAEWVLPVFEPTGFHKTYYEIADRFAHGRLKHLIIQAPPQHGKLLKDSTLTPTPKGFVRHGDLKVGDYVFNAEGRPIKVLGVSPKDKTEYRVTFADGSAFDCHGNHEWVVFHNKRWRIIEAKELAKRRLHDGIEGKRGNKYLYKVSALPIVEFKEQDVDIDAYTLGAWLGDGKSAEGVITIGNHDTEIIDNIPYKPSSNWIQKETGVEYYYYSTKDLRLTAYGLKNNKHIPDVYIYNSVECRKQLIAGLIDTDGYVYQKNGRVTISNTNKRIIDAASLILRSLGQQTTICAFESQTSSSGIVGRQTTYQLCFNPTLDFPTKVPRKRINRLVEPKMRSIVKVEPITNGEQGNCIEVEGGVYLIGDSFIPTHNSLCSSRLLPAFMLGLNPDLKICIASYAATIARDFNRDIQRIIDRQEYKDIFPETRLNSSNVVTTTNYLRNSECFEIIDHQGSLRVVGRGGSLTSKTCDIMIYDDLYKDAAEANSPVVREGAWQWYTKVAKTRLHNEAQELIVFTRWHKEDIIGKILDSEKVIEAHTWEDIEQAEQEDCWLLVNFEAIKTGEPTELDQRNEGEPLWAHRHSIERLLQQKAMDAVGFQCLFQGRPDTAEGRLYNIFKTWLDKKEYGTYVRSGCYTDVADEGSDYLCSICYEIYKSPNQAYNEKTKRFEPIVFALVTDVVYTAENTDVTTILVPEMVNRNGVQRIWIESNNGGAIFEKTIRSKVRCQCMPFTQRTNKESRIITSAPFVNNYIVMPFGWENRYTKFYQHVSEFLRNFGANEHDDAPDALTGIYEKEMLILKANTYTQISRGVKKAN